MSLKAFNQSWSCDSWHVMTRLSKNGLPLHQRWPFEIRCNFNQGKNTIQPTTYLLSNKALRKAEYSEFHIFAKFKTHFIPYIRNKLCQNRIFIFAKNSFRLKFWLKYLVKSSECRALLSKPIRLWEVYLQCFINYNMALSLVFSATTKTKNNILIDIGNLKNKLIKSNTSCFACDLSFLTVSGSIQHSKTDNNLRNILTNWYNRSLQRCANVSNVYTGEPRYSPQMRPWKRPRILNLHIKRAM